MIAIKKHINLLKHITLLSVCFICSFKCIYASNCPNYFNINNNCYNSNNNLNINYTNKYNHIYTDITDITSFNIVNKSTFLNELFADIAFDTINKAIQDSSNAIITDSISILSDTLNKSNINVKDTTNLDNKTQKSNSFLNDIIKGSSADSLVNDIQNKKIYLYNNCVIDYGSIHLEAGYSEIDYSQGNKFSQSIYATCIKDSLNNIVQYPKFRDGNEEFICQTMRYNFNTEQGYFTNVIMQQGEGYLHGEAVKRFADNSINAYKGGFTTCDLEHPHFQFRFKKGKIIPQDKIVTGAIHLEIEDIPLPLGAPFAIMPLSETRTSGVVIPNYGNSNERGYFLENGGYYWRINDYFDGKLLGDIYSRGSWAVKPSIRYKKRYKYDGSLGFSFAVNKLGIKGTSGYSSRNDFKIRWIHRQDAKARPRSSFSANVNFVTSSYNKYNPSTTTDYLSNTFSSSIAFQTSFLKNKVNLTLSAGHSQNTLNNTMTFTLPEFSLSVAKLYPFKRKVMAGKPKWYEKIHINYSLVGKNQLSSIDSLLLKEPILEKLNNGVKHSISIGFNTNLFKHINFSISGNYYERWYSKFANAYYISDTTYNEDGSPIAPHLSIEEQYGFKAARDFNLNTSLSTTLYGMVQFKKGYFRAVRHVVNPSVSFNYRPDFGTPFWGYYKDYIDANGELRKYSIFNVGNFNSLYGSPTDGASGSIGFNIGNSFEIKVRSKKDTITGLKKIKLIDNLNLSTNYDLAKDSLNWAPLTISGRTSIFPGLNINYSTQLSPYKVNENGVTINEFIWKTEKRLFAPPSHSWNLGFTYNITPSTFKKNKKKSDGEDQSEQIINHYDYIDWDNPWNVSINYNYSYIIRKKYVNGEIENDITKVSAVSLRGNVNMTPNWKVGYNLAFDLKELDLTYVNLSVYRDLHCWEMSFNWIPFGGQKSWSFKINVKAAMLNSLKYEKKNEAYREMY